MMPMMPPLDDGVFRVEECAHGATVLITALWPTELDQACVVELHDWLNGWLATREARE